MLELVNRARMDPNAEAKRLGIRLNEGVPQRDKISPDSKQVLAANDELIEAARHHSKWMNDNDQFSHFEGNKNPRDRMKDAGYVFSDQQQPWGENIAARFEARAIDDALATKLVLQSYEDLFIDKDYKGRGHRTNILSEDFQEIGIGQDIGKYDDGSRNWNSSMVTQDFARSGNKVFVTGVVYDDTVKNDDFFTVDEEREGVSVDGGGPSDTTGAGGGYELQFAANAGARTVTFAGGLSADVTLGSSSIKIDLVNSNEIWTNASVRGVSTAVAEIHALGIDDIDLTGSSSANAVHGNKGRNTLSGEGGNDLIDGDRGIDELHGGADADTFYFAKGDTGKTLARADVIADFSLAEGDLIDLSAMDANAKKNGNQAFTFIDDQGFHGKAGELRAFVNGNGDTLVQGDTNGDGRADFVILLDGNAALTEGSFDL